MKNVSWATAFENLTATSLRGWLNLQLIQSDDLFYRSFYLQGQYNGVNYSTNGLPISYKALANGFEIEKAVLPKLLDQLSKAIKNA